MESFETISMIIALLLMGVAVTAKMVTTYLIKRMNTNIATVDRIKQKILGELKVIRSQKKVAEQNKTMLTQRKEKIQKRITSLKKEVKKMEREEVQRQKKLEVMSGKVKQ